MYNTYHKKKNFVDILWANWKFPNKKEKDVMNI